MASITGSVALVTGASRGIGAAAATELARLGAHVVLTARTQGGLEETDDAIRAAGGTATLLPLDLRDTVNLDTIGPSLFERFGRLDILVHAGATLGKLTPVSHLTDIDWTEILATNLTATQRLIRTTAPLLTAAPAGRAVFLTDSRARQPKAYWGGYGATKAALEHLVLTWADELRSTRLRINLFDPGPVGTKLRAAAMPGEDASNLPKPRDVVAGLSALCLPDWTRHGDTITLT